MLITIYSNELSNNFRVDLKDNIILPPYSTLKMTNALLSLAHNFVIEVDTPIKVRYNNVANAPIISLLLAGTYTLAELAQYIELRINQNATNNGIRNMKCTMTYDLDKGYNAGCFNIQIEMTSLLVNLFRENVWTDANWGTFTENKLDSILDDATLSTEEVNGVNYLAITSIQKDGVEETSWGYCFINEEVIIENWLEPTTSVKLDQPPSTHNQPYGAMSFQDNDNTDNSYAVCLNQGKNNFTGITNNTFDDIIKWTDTPIVMLMCKSDAGGSYVDGAFVIFENNGGGLKEVFRNDTFTGNEIIGVSFSNGNLPEYYYADGGGTDWGKLIVSTTDTNRYTFSNGDNLKFGFSSFGKIQADAEEYYQVLNVFSSGKIDTDTNLEGYGQYVELDWNNNNNNDFGKLLGFDDDKYISNETGSSPAKLAKIDQLNEDKVSVLGYSTGAKTAPYINVNIDNLPIVSYGCNSTDDQMIGQNKCIASIPRYDFQGDFELNYNLVYNPVEANVIRLNNAEEISLSSLNFRLQQADGTYPIDIVSPKSFVLDLQSEENIKNKHFKM